MPSTRTGPLDFNYGIEELTPAGPTERASLPLAGLLQPSNQGPTSRIEELVHAGSFADAIDAYIRPSIPDLAICRPERYAALLAEASDILNDEVDKGAAGPEASELAAVLDRQGELRDLLGYYIQSLLSA